MTDDSLEESRVATSDAAQRSTEEAETGAPKSEKPSKPAWRKWVMLAVKLAFTAGMLYVIFSKVLGREGADDLGARIANLHWGWVAAAVGMQLTAIGFATLRWRALLKGQGIRPSWRFLGGSIMIARFWGAFTPGGFTGFGGWRIYDVAKHTGKTARATATIGVETLMGQMAFGLVVMGASIFGFEFLGTHGVIVVNLFFLGIVGTAVTLLARPKLFRFFARFLPGPIQSRVQTLVDAVCAYHGKAKLLGFALVCGVGVHAFNNLIYVCAARALGVELSAGMVFFASSLQIFATLIPASINGMGLRETAAVALYTSPAIGLPLAVAVLIPVVGFACEMAVSSVGGLIFLSRRSGYTPVIEVDDVEREEEAHEAIEFAPEAAWPKRLRGLTIGLGAGALAGMIIGIAEGAVVVASSNGTIGYGVLAYGGVAYGIFCGLAGGGLGLVLAWSGRIMRREAMPEADAYARITAFFVASFAFALGAFRIRRDVFAEELAWKSLGGLGVLLGCLLAGAILYVGISFALRKLLRWRPGSVMLRAWGSPVVVGALCGVLSLGTFLMGNPAEARDLPPLRNAPDGAGNVLFIVVDTLRADHLPQYGYDAIQTPALAEFADDAIRFNMAFANASWTRPSFASILSGRLPSNHGVMAKVDALPGEITTLPEALQEAGWQTRGIATNYNVSPYFNFHQGFDQYEYMEPEFVLGADDAAAKLLLIQTLKRVIEKIEAKLGHVAPGSAYRDAETVNARVFEWLDETQQQAASRGGAREGAGSPWFFFVGYMDPHDPYYPHPYDGTGYSRAANQRPDPSEAPRLMELYDGEIEYWDSQFGVLIEDLKRRGLYDDLTIVITADHGEEFCEHGGFWHGTTLYDEQIRIPLFVKLPGNTRGGTTIGHWTQSIDLMPTVLRLLDLEVPEGVQGGDIFEGTDRVYAEESHEGNVLESVRERRGTDEWKVITANQGNPRGLAPIELYRVDFDPGETENVAEQESEQMDSFLDALTEERNRAHEGAASGEAVDLAGEAAERLQAIGYMGD